MVETTTRTTRSTLESDTKLVEAASRAPDKLEQNLFVIPSHKQNQNQNRCQVSAANIYDSGNIIDTVDVVDSIDCVDNSDELAYEPCYKPSDIFAIYQNRLCFQGLKSKSTFGKNLRKSTARTSPASSSSSSSPASTSTSSSTSSSAAAAVAIIKMPDPKGPSHKRIYKTDAVINIQQQHNPDNAIQQEKAQ